MIPDRPKSRYAERLLEIARRSKVQVHLLPVTSSDNLGWDGLYLDSPELGAGIALRDNLTSEEFDWVLAHELGHHFSRLNLRLFSPFCPHMASVQVKKIARKPNRDEERANSWAARTLIDEREWIEAESNSPCDLQATIFPLRLPLAAAIAWNRHQRAMMKSSQTVLLKLGVDEWRNLHRSIEGHGGHQSFFRRVLGNPRRREAEINFHDFSLARERIYFVAGGWLPRYRTLLDAVEPIIMKAGSIPDLFKCTFARTID